MVSLLSIVLLVAAAVTAVGIAFRNRWLTVSAPSILFGGLSYFFVSMYAARFSGVGHFYSVPFGGYAVRDSSIMLSVLFWAALWGLALHLVLPRWHREKPENTRRKVNWKALVARTAAGIGPLAMTPALAWLISEGWLNFGGGCKDIIMIFPWMAWSLVYFIVFVVLTVKKRPLGRTVAVSAGVATGAMVIIWAALFAWSGLGVGH